MNKFSFHNNQIIIILSHCSLQGNITVRGNIDREKVQQYILIIQATDNPDSETERRTGTTSLTVIIDDLNDNAPKFEKNAYEHTIQEDIGVGKFVFTVSATDADVGQNSNVTYYFPVNDSDFNIDPMNGSISVKSSLKNKYGAHKLEVFAKDNGHGSLRSSASVSGNAPNSLTTLAAFTRLRAREQYPRPAHAAMTSASSAAARLWTVGQVSVNFAK